MPLIVSEFTELIVSISLPSIVKLPTSASNPELIIGDEVTFGIVTNDALVGMPLSQFPAKFQTELMVPVQLVLLIVNASSEYGNNVSPSPDEDTVVHFVLSEIKAR